MALIAPFRMKKKKKYVYIHDKAYNENFETCTQLS